MLLVEGLLCFSLSLFSLYAIIISIAELNGLRIEALIEGTFKVFGILYIKLSFFLVG